MSLPREQLLKAWVELVFLTAGKEWQGQMGMSTLSPKLLWPHRAQEEILAPGCLWGGVFRIHLWSGVNNMAQLGQQLTTFQTPRSEGLTIWGRKLSFPSHFSLSSPLCITLLSLTPAGGPAHSYSECWWAHCSRNGNRTQATAMPNAVCTNGSL